MVSLLWLVPTIIASGIGATWFATVAFYGIYAHNALPLSVLPRILHFAGIGAGVIAIIGGAAWSRAEPATPSGCSGCWPGIDLAGRRFRALPVPASAPAVDPLGLRGAGRHTLEALERSRARSAPAALWVGSAVLAAGILLAAAQGSYAGSFWINGRSLSTYYADGYSSLVNATERTRWQNSFSDSIVDRPGGDPLADGAPLRECLSGGVERRR